MIRLTYAGINTPPFWVNPDQIVWFAASQLQSGGTNIYLVGGLESGLYVSESPEEVVALIEAARGLTVRGSVGHTTPVPEGVDSMLEQIIEGVLERQYDNDANLWPLSDRAAEIADAIRNGGM